MTRLKLRNERRPKELRSNQEASILEKQAFGRTGHREGVTKFSGETRVVWDLEEVYPALTTC